MPEDLGTSVLNLDGDLKPLGRKLQQAEDQAKRSGKAVGDTFARDLKRAAVPALAVLGAIGLGAVKSIDAASDLGEQVNKATVVFEKSAPEIIAWGRTTAGSFGISNRAALEAAGTFGNMLKPMGLAVPLTAKMSRGLVELAADMASFNNASPEETLEALRSGLAGETEPLRKFGVFLNEARIRSEALGLGLIKNAKADIPAAAKAQAVYSLILKDTSDAQGDFARTSDSVANQQRIMRAEVEDLAAQLGMALLPAVQELLSVGLELLQWMSENEAVVKALATGIGAFATAILLANASLAIYNAQLVTAIGLSKALRVALAATPWGAAALGAALLVEHFLSQEDSADSATRAQQDLNEAVRDYNRAVKEGKSAREEYLGAQRRQESAEIALQRAIIEEKRVNKDANSTLLDRREASLAVSEAHARLRQATDDVSAAGDKWRTKAQQQNAAAIRQRTEINLLARKFEDWRTGLGRINTPLERLRAGIDKNTFAMHTGRQNAERYAAAVSRGADRIRASAPKLARTADTAAALATAWGRVVSLPEARSFVARFRVISTIEEHRTENRQHGGDVRQWQPYVVGESGPELFFPHADGTVLSNLASGRFADRLMDSPTTMRHGAVRQSTVEIHNHFPRYTGTRRELVADIRKGVEEHRRANGGQEPW